MKRSGCLSFIIPHSSFITSKAEAVRLERTGAGKARRLSTPLHYHLCGASEGKDEDRRGDGVMRRPRGDLTTVSPSPCPSVSPSVFILPTSPLPLAEDVGVEPTGAFKLRQFSGLLGVPVPNLPGVGGGPRIWTAK